jgi:hypothetical protein
MLVAADEMNGCRQGAGSTAVSATLCKASVLPVCEYRIKITENFSVF